MTETIYRIEIKGWSHTDYSFLANETNGWVDDTQKFYEFYSEEDYIKMLQFLLEQKV
jgi:hypothetical protein